MSTINVLHQSGLNTSQSSTSTPSIAFNANTKVFATFAHAGNTQVPTASSSTLTWTQVAGGNINDGTRNITTFEADVGGSPPTEAITFTTTSNHNRQQMMVLDDDLSGSVQQVDTNSGASTASVTNTLAAIQDAGNDLFQFAYTSTGGSSPGTPESGWTEQVDAATSGRGRHCQTRTGGDTSPLYTTSGTPSWVSLALEIGASGGAATEFNQAIVIG